MKAFLDTSSLVKLYHYETDSDNTVESLSNDIEEIFLSDLAIIEFRSAVWKKVREDKINEDIAVNGEKWGRVLQCYILSPLPSTR